VNQSEPPPDSVFQDLDEHPELVKRWVTDQSFREQVVRADYPADAVEQLSDITLHDDTKEWINRRVRDLGPDALLEFGRPIAF
jgi:hypothetical protein